MGNLSAEEARSRILLWTRMWNGEVELARDICASDVRIFFGRDASLHDGDSISTVDELVAFVEAFRETSGTFDPGVAKVAVEFTDVAQKVGQDLSWATSLWNVAVGNRNAGGIDLFEFNDEGLIEAVYSVTGQRPVVSIQR
ncbi:hypothetical protein [Tsukamurella ocularis]|uniref:hypothetical protein n=1 Tax=Tsukamurella ocularis TaxID=1970234 RepID=UPI002169D0F3|nr:hypothetical protein [Tsukamurella ocularis]MCS3779344.1 hypothetical protein [Tsukamurella ocularis]MCS3789930.1 hypothetical protein [Tsukamurella ocularis]MCS3852427.1 hypothetical protein [Tsukamurella ocularis]